MTRPSGLAIYAFLYLVFLYLPVLFLPLFFVQFRDHRGLPDQGLDPRLVPTARR